MQFLMLFTLPNIITFSRIPLAFLFLQENIGWRLFAVIFALFSDGLDGYLARRQKVCSKFGTLLDPLADKFFVIFVAIIYINEGNLHLWQAIALACRDISVLLFGTYLVLNKRLNSYQFRAIQCGKITTIMQFLVLLGLTLHVAIPSPLYIMFILLGILSLVELAITRVASEA